MRCQNQCQQGNSLRQEIRTPLLQPKGNNQNSATGAFFDFKQALLLTCTCGLNLATLQGNDYNEKILCKLWMQTPLHSKNNCHIPIVFCFPPHVSNNFRLSINYVAMRRRIFKRESMPLDLEQFLFLLLHVKQVKITHTFEKDDDVLSI